MQVMRNAIKSNWKIIGGFQISCENVFYILVTRKTIYGYPLEVKGVNHENSRFRGFTVYVQFNTLFAIDFRL